MTPELLAPAGSFSAAIAAFTYGADAVYLGLNRFSARADATNFSPEELEQLVAYARNLPRPRKVYVTLNTLLENHEFDALSEPLALLERLGVDGVIVQDLGLASYIRRAFPALPLHASTQLSCTSTAGARALKALGFSRVVTARELTLRDASEIGTRAGIEIEVFIHGALCYSISGLCLFSSLTTGRSGNRGRCAYCCRQSFNAPSPCHPFSMRDLALMEQGKLLRQLPLASLKIEGRMKNPLYVAAVTDLYRHVLDNDLSPEALARKAEDLRTIFSRPWSSLYALDPHATPETIIDPLCAGHRGTPIGTVRRVWRDTDGVRWLSFTTSRALERHDGLQVDLPGRPVGFPVDRLRDAMTRRPAITLPAGSRVEVALPREVETLPQGAVIACSASQAVRRAFPVPKPRQTELRSLRPADLTLTLSPDAITLSGCGVSQSTPATLTPAKDPAKTEPTARAGLERLGDDGFFLRSLTLCNPDALFLPASLLNATRRAWAQSAREALTEQQAQKPRVEVRHGEPPAPSTSDKPRFSLKVSALQRPETFGLSAEHPLSELKLPGSSASGKLEELVVALTPETTLHDLQAWMDVAPRASLRFALPVALRNAEIDGFLALVNALLDRGWRKFECADLTSWQILQDLQPACDALDITADWTWYATNAEARHVQQACGLTGAVTSPEENLENLLFLGGEPPRIVLLAQYTPLFIAFTSPYGAKDRFTSRTGDTLRTTRLGSLWSTFNERPWRILDALPTLLDHGFRLFRLDLSWAGNTLDSLSAQNPLTHLLTHPEPIPNAFTHPRL